LEQSLLERVLGGPGLVRHAAAVGQELLAVPANQCLERGLVSLARKLDEPSVGLGLQKPQ
jgi:hypothetical protein